MLIPGASAVAYLRVSGKAQAEGDGFRRQREAVKRYARSNKLAILSEYCDAGVSGTRELEGRDGLASLLDHVETAGIPVVLVERADRLARDLLVSEIILNRFRDSGVRVIAAESGTELTVTDEHPTRKLIRQVLGAIAEYDKTVTVLKLRAARLRIRQLGGRCEGRKPYPSEVVALIRKLRRKPRGGRRRSWAEIARELDDRGIPTKTGCSWSRGVIWSIARREGIS